MSEHKASVMLTYANDGRTPYKWRWRCHCGAWGLSWAWRRSDEEGDLPYVSGALSMAIRHVGLLSEDASPYASEA